MTQDIRWHWSRSTPGRDSWGAFLRAGALEPALGTDAVAIARRMLEGASAEAREVCGAPVQMARAFEGQPASLPAWFSWGRVALPLGRGLPDAIREALEQKAFDRALVEIRPALEMSSDAVTVGELQLVRASLLLGSFENAEVHTSDFAASRQSFIAAKESLERTLPDRAALAALGAGFATYVLSETGAGTLEDAIRWTQEAGRLDPSLHEAAWQEAKLQMAAGRPEVALPLLKKASAGGILMLARAAGDADFQRHDESLLVFLRSLRDARGWEQAELAKTIANTLRTLTEWHPAHAARPEVQGLLALERSPIRTLAQAFRPGLEAELAALEGERVVVQRMVTDEWQEGVLAGPVDLLRSAASGRGEVDPVPRVGDLKRTVTRRGPPREEKLVLNGLGGPWTGTPVRIGPGRFPMGASADDTPTLPEEMPREVVLTRAIEVWSVPVTQAQYSALMGANPAYFKSADRPVETVTWFEAVQFCNALSRRQGLPEAYELFNDQVRWKGPDHPGWRLPTEAEWEYACRGGVEAGRYGALDDIAWHNQNASGRTQPVSLKEPNAHGLYDMLGNVYEWCWDVYDDKFYRRGTATDPVNENGGASRVVRGGSWYSVGWRSRASYRHGVAATTRNGYTGFRVVRTMPNG